MAPSFARVGEGSTSKLSTPKYSSVPSALRDQLSTAFEKACSKYTTGTVEPPAASYRTQYELKKATIYLIPKSDRQFTTITTGFAFAEAANIALLEHIIDTNAIDFANLNTAQCERSCAALELAHPEFLDVHAVEKGGLSWGEDTFACLSLCTLVEEGDHGLKLEAYFVQRVYGSGEDGPRMGALSPSSKQSDPPEQTGLKFSIRLPGSVKEEKAKEGKGDDDNRLDKMLVESERKARERSWERKEREYQASP
jgi:hypothetical protein